MKNLYEMLDHDGESIGVVSTIMNMPDIESLWTEYCAMNSDESLDMDEFIEKCVRPKDATTERLFIDQVSP